MSSTPRAWRSVVLGAAFLAGAVAALPLLATRAASAARAVATAGACADADDVTVVVDFGTLAGGVQTRCAKAPVSTGYDALERAGFEVTGTQSFQGLLCRIDGKPADDPCQRAPKADYYWAYWTASAPGGSWTYSNEGAATRKPPPGSVEGWAFSDGCTRKPGASTTCSSATSTTASETSTSSTASTPPVGDVNGSGGTAGTHPGASGATTLPNAPDGSSTGDTTIDGTALPSAGHDDDHSDDFDLDLEDRRDAVASRPAEPDSGSPAGVIAGAAVAGALALAAARRLRQRRRAPLAGSAGE